MQKYFINYNYIKENFQVKQVGRFEPYSVDISFVISEHKTKTQAEKKLMELEEK